MPRTVALFSLGGAPGVTCAAMALSAVWPGGTGAVLVEADASGGDVATWRRLQPDPGLTGLAAAARHGGASADLAAHTQILPGGLSVCHAPVTADRAEGAVRLLSQNPGVLASPSGPAVVLDLGRLTPGAAASALATWADEALLLVADDLAQLRRAKEASEALTRSLPFRQRGRISGLGIAMPFQFWNWAQFIGAPQREMDQWRSRDIQAEIADLCDMPVYTQNDANAACGAELVFGTGDKPQDFLYFYIGYFVGGGLVLNGSLYPGRTGNAGALGSMPVPAPDGTQRQLISVASTASLERYLIDAGADTDQLWESPESWDVPADILDRWLDEVAFGLSHAILAAAAVIDFEAALVDGWLPQTICAALVERTGAKLQALDSAGIELPQVRQGTVGHQARSLGAASIALSQRYLIDKNALLKES